MAKRRQRRQNYCYKLVDIPSDMLFTCYYCGEPASDKDHVPPVSRFHDYYALYDRHEPLLIPSCSECNSLLSDSLQPDIYKRAITCKIKLTQKLGKYVRYGEIWDEDSVEYAAFTGDMLKFAESALKMKRIVERRLKWEGWPLSLEGVELEIEKDEEAEVKIGNRKFATLDHLYHHARKVDKIPTKYLEAVIGIVGKSKVEYAYNFCRTNKVKSEKEMNRRLKELQELVDDLA